MMDWTREFSGWTMNYIAKHIWKLRGWMWEDDLLQEGWMVFERMLQRRPNLTPRQAMALYMVSYDRWFGKQVGRKQRTERKMVELAERRKAEQDRSHWATVTDPPVLVRRLLAGLHLDAQGNRLQGSRRLPAAARASRDGMNAYLRRVAKISGARVDVVVLVERWLDARFDPCLCGQGA